MKITVPTLDDLYAIRCLVGEPVSVEYTTEKGFIIELTEEQLVNLAKDENVAI